MRWFVLVLVFLTQVADAATKYTVAVVERVDQDPTIFTQGLEIQDHWFFQSSGLYGKSYLLRYPTDGEGKVERLDVPPNVFAEGITVFSGKLYLLSWKAGTAWQFDASTLQLEKTFRYSGEGWGLSHNDKELIMSDGTDTIRFIDPTTFNVTRTVKVKWGEKALTDINELEFAKGIIWANQWKSTTLFGIDPVTGEVKITVDISSLQQEAAVTFVDSVANGIAFDSQKDLFWITGKYWKYRYLVKFNPT